MQQQQQQQQQQQAYEWELFPAAAGKEEAPADTPPMSNGAASAASSKRSRDSGGDNDDDERDLKNARQLMAQDVSQSASGAAKKQEEVPLWPPKIVDRSAALVRGADGFLHPDPEHPLFKQAPLAFLPPEVVLRIARPEFHRPARTWERFSCFYERLAPGELRDFDWGEVLRDGTIVPNGRWVEAAEIEPWRKKPVGARTLINIKRNRNGTASAVFSCEDDWSAGDPAPNKTMSVSLTIEYGVLVTKNSQMKSLVQASQLDKYLQNFRLWCDCMSAVCGLIPGIVITMPDGTKTQEKWHHPRVAHTTRRITGKTANSKFTVGIYLKVDKAGVWMVNLNEGSLAKLSLEPNVLENVRRVVENAFYKQVRPPLHDALWGPRENIDISRIKDRQEPEMKYQQSIVGLKRAEAALPANKKVLGTILYRIESWRWVGTPWVVVRFYSVEIGATGKTTTGTGKVYLQPLKAERVRIDAPAGNWPLLAGEMAYYAFAPTEVPHGPPRPSTVERLRVLAPGPQSVVLRQGRLNVVVQRGTKYDWEEF